MFPFANYKDFVKNQSVLMTIEGVLKEVLYECYTTTDYNNGSFNQNLLSKMYKTYDLNMKLFYPILISDLYPREKYLALKKIILELTINKVKEFIIEELYNDFEQDNLNILTLVGIKIVNHDFLCPLTLTFKNGKTLKINKLLFPYFDCFGYFDQETPKCNEVCDYDYDCVKVMIDYFFIGSDEIKEDLLLPLAFEINKLGFISPLTQKIMTLINAKTIIPTLYNTNSFYDFLAKCEILIVMSNETLPKNNMALCVMIFLKGDLDYDISALLHSSCYQTYIKSHMTRSGFFITKLTTVYDTDINKGLDLLSLLPHHLMEDQQVMDRLYDLTDIDDKVLSKLSLRIQLELGLKFKKYDFLDTLLPIDIPDHLLMYLAKFYKTVGQNTLKWTYVKQTIKNEMHCLPTQMNYNIQNCLRFMHIHSFNPMIPRHLVIFNYIGIVHSFLKNEKIGVIINLANTSYELDIHKKLYIGEHYTNNIVYGINQLGYIKFVDEVLEYCSVNTLLNTSNKVEYGGIIFDQMYDLQHIKVGDAIFIEKEF